jgi:MFS family permease
LPVLALVMLLAALGTSIANVGLPALADAFGASFAEVRWVVIAYLVEVTALVVGAGALGDRFGARRTLLGGLMLFSAGSALCALAPQLWLLVAARFVQGAGAAVMMATALPLAAGLAPAGGAGRAMGLLGSASAIGTAAGPVAGGLLLAAFGWRALFLATVPLGLLTLLLAARRLPRAPAGPVERNGGLPLHALLRDAPLRAALAASLLAMTVMMTTLVVGPFHLARSVGLDAAGVGLAMGAGPAAAALAGVPAGRLVDRFGASAMVAAGLGGMSLGAVLLALFASAGVAGYVLPLVVLTAAFALFQAANNSAAMAGAVPASRGAVSGLLQLSRNLGLIAGAFAMGGLFASASGGAAPELVAHGTRVTFLVAALLLAAALAVVKTSRPLAPARGRGQMDGPASPPSGTGVNQ